MRKVIFWIHLTVGIVMAAIVLIMSVTGVLLTYEKQTIAWSDRAFQSKPTTAGAAQPSIEKILNQSPKAASVTIYRDPQAAASISLGRAGNAFVDAYTGDKLGVPTTEVRGFLGASKELHRWLALQGQSRATGRAITGAANLGFLFLVISGAYLWLPAVFSPKHFRAIAWFRSGLSGKARDFNWHNVIGIWCVIPLFFIVISGVVIGYGWASDLVFKLAGSPAPQAQQPQPAPQQQQPHGAPKEELSFAGIDAALQAAMRQDPNWKSISLRTPSNNNAPLTFTIDSGTGGEPQKRGTLTYDRASARTTKWETFDSLDKGRQWRTWLRFVHTGEYYGIIGQTIAGLASLGGAFLVWTGVALSLRRFIAWRKRKRNAATHAAAPASQQDTAVAAVN